MKKKKINGFVKTFIMATAMTVVVLGGIITSLSILKDEAIKTHLKIAELQVNTIASQITQTFNSIDFIISDLKKQLQTSNDELLLNKHFSEILKKSPYIRSINILDENKKIIFSSNSLNIDLHLDTNDFYPRPLFGKSILRFGNPWIGRDLIEAVEITKTDFYSHDSLSFLPVLKKTKIKNKEFYILIATNLNYFANRNQKALGDNNITFDIYRVDGMLLFSSNNNNIIGTNISDNILFNEAINKNKSMGIDTYKKIKYMSAYHLTNTYPLNIAIRLNFDETLIEWERKRENIIVLISALIIVCAILIGILIYKYNLEKERELKFHKKKLEDKKRFQILFEQNTFLAITLRSDGSIIEINNIALKFLGISTNEILNKKIWELYCWNKEDRTWLKEEIKSFEKNSKTQKTLFPKNKNGKEIVLDFNLTSLEIDDNFELLAMAIDITQKREKEEKLKHAYVVFQNAHDGIIITDKDGLIITVNKAFSNSSGYSMDEVINKNPNILNSGVHDKKFYENMWNSILTTGLWEGELINKKKDDTLYNERLTINAVFDENHTVKNFIGIFSDITQQKKQERILKEQEKLIYQQSKLAAMGEMIENIAHQWRQPLSVISSAVTGMQLQKELDIDGNKEDDIKNLVLVNQSVQYLSKTIDDFRNFLKTDKIKSKISIKETIEKSLNLLSSKLKNRNISIIKNMEDLTINGIENELLQVFMNIFSNAKDVLENKNIDNKMIFIDIFKDNKNVIILIKDNAGGINESIISRVFEPYFTTKHKSQGTGIGLYMSQEIIRNHMSGTINCDNVSFEYDSKKYAGAQFKITLPLTL